MTKDWKKYFMKNYIESTDGGILVKWVGEDGVDIDDWIENEIKIAYQNCYMACLREEAGEGICAKTIKDEFLKTLKNGLSKKYEKELKKN